VAVVAQLKHEPGERLPADTHLRLAHVDRRDYQTFRRDFVAVALHEKRDIGMPNILQVYIAMHRTRAISMI
jgi:hypothetical protein